MTENFENPESTEPEVSKPKKRGLIVAVVALVLVVAGVAGGGVYFLTRGPSDAEIAAAEKAKEEREAKEKAEKLEAERLAAIEVCQDEMSDYIAALQDLDSQLNVGMNQSDYAAEVRDITTVENDVDDDEFNSLCDTSKRLADQAVSTYASIAGEWNDCIWDDYCDTDWDVDFSGWNKASTLIEDAEDAMNGKDPNARSS